MNNFDRVIDDLLEVEGGFVNHPNDKGGATNWGITIGTLETFRGQPVTIGDVKNLSRDEAKLIYKAKYWDSLRLDDVFSLLVAKLVFDQSVNRGPVTAAKNIQNAYNSLSKNKIKEDGRIGPQTLNAINSTDHIELSLAFLKDAQLDYAMIVRQNRSQSVFIVGWIARTHKLLDDIISAIRNRHT